MMSFPTSHFPLANRVTPARDAFSNGSQARFDLLTASHHFNAALPASLGSLIRPIIHSLSNYNEGAQSISYSSKYMEVGQEWLDVADMIAQADRSTIERLTAQYRQADNPLNTELGKILVHTGLIPQNKAPLMDMTADAVWFHKHNITQQLRAKGEKSMEVARAIEVQKATRGIDGMEPELRALDTGSTRHLGETQLRNVIALRVAMGQLTPTEGAIAQRDVYNSAGKVTFTVLEAINLIALKRSIRSDVHHNRRDESSNLLGLTSVERLEIQQYLQGRADEIRSGLPKKLRGSGNLGVAQINIQGLPTELRAHSRINYSTDKGSDGFVHLAEKPSWIFHPKAVDPDNVRVNTPDAYTRMYDTEFKILNDVALRLGDNRNVTGSINLFTERLACSSCTDIIFDFKNRYPNIQLNVFAGEK